MLHQKNNWQALNFNTGQTRSFFSGATTGEQWLPDKKYSKGSWGYVNGEVWNKWPSPSWNGMREGIHKPIINTDNDALFQTFVEGLTSWKADVPGGAYRVKLLLCEPFTTAQRNGTERIINISINGEQWHYSLNLEKAFGILTAAEIEKEIIVKHDEGIEIHFEALSGRTILNGISIKKL